MEVSNYSFLPIFFLAKILHAGQFETDGIPFSIFDGGSWRTVHLVLSDSSILQSDLSLSEVSAHICEHQLRLFDENCPKDLKSYLKSYEREEESYTPSRVIEFMFKDVIWVISNSDDKMQMSVHIGKGTYGQPNIIWRHTNYSTMPGLWIGRFCSIAPGVTIHLDSAPCKSYVSTYPWHQRSRSVSRGDTYSLRVFDVPKSHCNESAPKSTRIGHDVWIAASATIMSGVSVGDGAIVGAFAVVTNDVEPYSIVVGNPSVTIGYRFSREVIQELLAVRWWDWTDDELDDNMDVLALDDNPQPFLDRARALHTRRQRALEAQDV